MTPAPVARGLLPLALSLVIGSLPFAWVPIANIGGFDLRLPYATALLLGGVLCLFPGKLAQGLRHLVPAMAPWLVVYALYLVVLFFGLAGGGSKGMIVRQVFFLLCGGVVALAIIATQADPKVFRRGGLLAICGFLAVSEALAWQLGLSWITVIRHLASTGDIEFVFYQFLKEMFQLVLPPGTEAQASDKNAVAVALLTALFLVRAGCSQGGSDRLGQVITVLTLAVLVILNTRSALLLAAIGLPLAGWIGTVRDGVRDLGEFTVKSVLFFGIMIGAIVVLSMESAATALIDSRFSFSDASSGNRFDQYAWAMQRIESAPLWGSGMGEFKGQPIHNLFLGAWMHAGLFAFVLVGLAYLMVVVGWFVFVVRVTAQKGSWVMAARAEWIAVLPLVPLFRVWIAGDAGHPSFVETTSLCAFMALIVTNRLVRRRAR